MAVSVASRVRQDIELQRRYDHQRSGHHAALLARMAAVLGAQQALATREEGAEPALRQSLIDLASISEELAGEL